METAAAIAPIAILFVICIPKQVWYRRHGVRALIFLAASAGGFVLAIVNVNGAPGWAIVHCIGAIMLAVFGGLHYFRGPIGPRNG